ncbi:hypothetical protein MHB44_14405 [Lysinibacillus sp. FSL H8-0500]|uniref:hypothetical protein n=1 Tax=Lysinibacillus sp. FSL H8-0500 TaxID=2921393 RepID=UPI003100B848
MYQTELLSIVSTLLQENAISCEDYRPNEVLIKLEDIDQEINGKDVCIYLREGLLMHGYEEIEFDFDDDDDNVLIVSAIQSRNDEEERTRLVTTVLTLLGENVIEHERFQPDSITMNLVNINKKYEGKSIDDFLVEALTFHGFEDIHFNYGDRNWLTVYAKDPQDSLVEQSRLMTTVLTLLGSQVLEFEEYHPNSITVNLVNVNKIIKEKDLFEYLKEALEFHGFEKVRFNAGAGNWITVLAKDGRDMYAKKSKLTMVVLTLLRGAVVEYEEVEQDKINVNLIDCNMKIQNKDVEVYLEEGLLLQGFENIQFTFGDGHWLFVEAQEPQNDDVELSKLATTVLSLLGNTVYEYSVYCPDSISINSFNCNKKFNGKGAYEFLKDALELQGYKDIQYYGGNGHWWTIFATEPECFETVDLVMVVDALIGNDVLKYEELDSDTLAINLVDCNKKYGRKDVHAYLDEALKIFGFKELQLSYGDDNWLTIIAKQPQTI